MVSQRRGIAGRWVAVLVVATVAAMIGIRACSVRRLAHEPRGSDLQTARHLDNPTAAPADGAGEAAAFGRPSAAFEHTVCAWNEIRIGGDDGAGTVVVGSVHNNAEQKGEIRIEGDSRVYGRVTSAGTIALGASEGFGPATVNGSIAGDAVIIGELGEVRDFTGLQEWLHGVDLNGDGDLDDLDAGETPALVAASGRILCGKDELASGGTHERIADGTRSVEVGGARPGALPRVQPDFRAYYEAAAGAGAYPPEGDHVVCDIPGDGDAHYFSSAKAFLAWVNAARQSDVLCWRCAGDGAIDPDDATVCPECAGSGKAPAVEIAGIFYIDDETLDLGAIETNLVVHGTIVVAEGNPYQWPIRRAGSLDRRGGSADRHPEKGSFVIGGPTRMHYTQTRRSAREGGPYVWRHRTIHRGDDRQTLCAAVPEDGQALSEFPAIVAASSVRIAPRAAGFARHRGDVGDEAVAILEGGVHAGQEIRLGGRGGWRGEPIVFREDENRSEDEILDESILRIDLNEDGDVFDRLRLADVSGCPVIRVGKGRYHVDINNDGVLGTVVVGEDYGEFFAGNGWAPPTLLYNQGTLVAESIHIGAQSVVADAPSRDDSRRRVHPNT